jgi:uncharacterized protein YjlB
MLTEAVVQSLSSVPSIRENGFTEYDLNHGNALAFKVLKKTKIAVADSFLSEGTIFPYHKHDGCREVLIVYEGEVSVISDDPSIDRISLTAGELTIIEKCAGHMIVVKKDSWVLGITMPADKDFPG